MTALIMPFLQPRPAKFGEKMQEGSLKLAGGKFQLKNRLVHTAHPHGHRLSRHPPVQFV